MTKCQVSLKITPNGLLWYCTIPNATWDLHCSLHLPQSTSFCLALISFSFFKLSLIWRYCPNEKLCEKFYKFENIYQIISNLHITSTLKESCIFLAILSISSIFFLQTMLLDTVMKRVHQAAATTHSPLSPVKTIGPLPGVKTTNKCQTFQQAKVTSMQRFPRSTNFLA